MFASIQQIVLETWMDCFKEFRDNGIQWYFCEPCFVAHCIGCKNLPWLTETLDLCHQFKQRFCVSIITYPFIAYSKHGIKWTYRSNVYMTYFRFALKCCWLLHTITLSGEIVKHCSLNNLLTVTCNSPKLFLSRGSVKSFFHLYMAQIGPMVVTKIP